MLRLALGAALAFCTPFAALAQAPASHEPPEAPAGLWRQSDDHLTFTTANIDVPRAPGVVHFTRSFEFSHHGEGIDSGLQFESPDRQVFATIYVYYPGLPHAGLTAFATDWVIHDQSPNLRPLGMRVVAAGGHDGVAIRGDYANFRDGLASSAAFIKIGRWILKLRVSGREERRADVEATMTALLAGLRFQRTLQPRPAAMLDVTDCSTPSTTPANLLPDDVGTVGVMALLGTIDGAGVEAHVVATGGTTLLPGRVGTAWCVSMRTRIGNSNYQILRARPPLASGSVDGHSMIMVPFNDAGTTLEAVRIINGDRVILLFHEIGRTSLLGTYDAVPSDEQVANILSGADEPGTRFRAVATLRPGQGDHIDLRVPETQSTPARH